MWKGCMFPIPDWMCRDYRIKYGKAADERHQAAFMFFYEVLLAQMDFFGSVFVII